MATGIGASIVVGMLLGAAGGGFVRARSLEWRSTAAAVDTLAPWRGKATSSPAQPDAGGGSGALFDLQAPGCPNCSDFERGYAWAERTGVASTAECESYSWSYQRGCMAWLRSGRRGATASYP